MAIFFTMYAVSIILVIIGAYNILAYIIQTATRKAEKTASLIVQIKNEKGFKGIFQRLALKLSGFIPMDEVKYNRIKMMLRYQESGTSEPKVFVAENIMSAASIAFIGILFLPLLSKLSFLFFILALMKYYMDSSKLYNNYMIKKREIEYELPRFCGMIGQEVKATRDVLGILSRYAATTNKALSKELKITIADMNSSNYESALKRFESRLSIDKLAEITRGLISTVRGDDTVAYFELLSKDLDSLELQRLNDIAARQPAKISKYQLLILVTMIINYVIVLAVHVINMEKPF